MAKCIKSLLLAAIKTEIESLIPAVLKTVTFNPVVKPVGADADKQRPYCVLIDEAETVKEDNLYRLATFRLLIATITWSETPAEISEALDEVQAKIHGRMRTPGLAFKEFCQHVKELDPEKMFLNDNEGLVITPYQITYKHVLGDAYSINP